MKIKRKLEKGLMTFLAFGIFLPRTVFAEALEYKLMEKIPGFENASTDLPNYIISIYKFGLWSIGIAALLMITLGGFMYITSAGNASSAGKAKKFITDALAGLILAFVAFLILYTLNPDLVKIRLDGFNLSSDSGGNLANNTTGGGGVNTDLSKICDGNSTEAIDFSKAEQDTSIKLSSTCDKYNFSNDQGVDPCILRAMAQIESSCGANKGKSSAGSCGLMQITPSTATALNGSEVTCDQLRNDDALSIRLAIKYIKQNMGNSCVSSSSNNTAAIFAGYNSGYGCGGNACTGTKASLCPSSDCAGTKAFECCKNPGGLGESIKYTWNGYSLYRKCQAGQ